MIYLGHDMKYINSKKKLIGIIVLAILLIGIAGFVVYVSDYYHADNAALAALNSTSSYNVINTDDYITFTPTGKKSTTGIIFYPEVKFKPNLIQLLLPSLLQMVIRQLS